MRHAALAICLSLALWACGRSGESGAGGGAGPATSSNNEACQALGDVAAIFGADADVHGYPGLEGMAASCEFASADGAKSGDVIVYSAQSLGAVTLETQRAEIVARWDGQTETPLAPLAALGDGAAIATDLPGYQTHIVFRQGDKLVAIAGRAGDGAGTGEALARRMAGAAAAQLASPAHD